MYHKFKFLLSVFIFNQSVDVPPGSASALHKSRAGSQL